MLVLALIHAKKFHLLRLRVVRVLPMQYLMLAVLIRCKNGSATTMRRDTQVQASLLYGQMGSDIMALNKIIQKLK